MNDRENPLTLRYRFEAKKTPELERLEKMLGKSPPPRGRGQAGAGDRARHRRRASGDRRLRRRAAEESNDTVAGRARNRRVELVRK